MSEATLTREQTVWAAIAAAIFLLSLGWLGIAITNGVMLAFAIGWPVLQVAGYVGSLKRAHGDTAHYLFKAQVMLNIVVVALFAAIIVRAS